MLLHRHCNHEEHKAIVGFSASDAKDGAHHLLDHLPVAMVARWIEFSLRDKVNFPISPSHTHLAHYPCLTPASGNVAN
jgi:hypothetical protein